MSQTKTFDVPPREVFSHPGSHEESRCEQPRPKVGLAVDESPEVPSPLNSGHGFNGVSSPSSSAESDSLNVREPHRYRILAEHARGGLGRIYRARDTELGRDVALKELLRPNPSAERRFIQEALITARLEHPGIVPVHDARRWADGTPYYSMKLVAGRSLAVALAECKTLEERLRLFPHVAAVADAIAYAHAKGVIHRDLKPSNVIVGEFGETVVIDWGLAKDLMSAHSTGDDFVDSGAPSQIHTMAGSVLGTPAYMSPEQARGESADRRSDIYSLGAILFEVCTGSPPPTDAAISNLRWNLRGISSDLAAIALKCLAFDPTQRYQEASALTHDLRAYDAGARVAARRYGMGAILAHWVRSHRSLSVAIGVFVVVFALTGLVSLREILAQRDRSARAHHRAAEAQRAAEGALRSAELERDRSVESQARLLIERDPTKARELLEGKGVRPIAESVLQARAIGAGTADRVISFAPNRVFRAWADPNLNKLIVASADGKLRLVDLRNGRVTWTAQGITDPPIVAFRGRGSFLYGRRSAGIVEMLRNDAPATSVRLGPLHPSYENPSVSARDGAYILDKASQLLVVRPEGHIENLGGGVRGVSPFGDGVVACGRDGLVALARGKRNQKLGPCLHDGSRYSMASTFDRFVAQRDSRTAIAVGPNSKRLINVMAPNAFAISDQDLIVGVGKNNETWYLRPEDTSPHPGPVSSAKPTSLAASGNLAVWGFADGSIGMTDTASGAGWSFMGHSAAVSWLFADSARGRIVSVGGAEIRTWPVPVFVLRPVGHLPCGTGNVVPSLDRKYIAFDCAEGTVGIYDRSRAQGQIRELHRHSSMAFGIAWNGEDVCSSGWDGKLICTNVLSGRTQVVATYSEPVRFVAANQETLAWIVADGTAWVRWRATDKPTLLHRQGSEPYRISVSESGDVAFGDELGDLVVYDRASGMISRARVPHKDLVFDVRWHGEDIVTTSRDGTTRLWNKRLSILQELAFSRPLRELGLLKGGGWVFSGASSLFVHLPDEDYELPVEALIRDVGTSPDGRKVVAVAGGFLYVLDVSLKHLAAVSLGGPQAGCAQFLDSSSIIACTASGEMVSVALSTLKFVPFLAGTNDVRQETSARLGHD